MGTTTKTGRRRYRLPRVERRAGTARSEIGQQALLAQAIERSESLVSQLTGANATKKGAAGRTIEILWGLALHPRLDHTPLLRELMLAPQEAVAHGLEPDEIVRRFDCARRREHTDEGGENLATDLLLSGDIGLAEWLERVRPEFNATLAMISLAEVMVENGIEYPGGAR